MAQSRSVLERAVFVLMGVVVLLIALAYFLQRPREKESPLPALEVVPAFALTNQLGELATRDDLDNQLWLANIVFSRCAGPCPKLSLLFEDLNRALANVSDLRFVSLTADPLYDTVPILAQYGARFKADPARWWFLTGPKAELYGLAVDGLKLAVVEKQPEEREDANDLFIHSTVITLVDRRGRPRAFFEGLEPGTPARIEAAVRRLAAEK